MNALADRHRHRDRAALADGLELLLPPAGIHSVHRRAACQRAADGAGRLSRQRSYSITSAPGTTGHIELAIERLEDGEVSPFFHDVVEVGDEIELSEPIGGHFIWRAEDGGPVLLDRGRVRHRAVHARWRGSGRSAGSTAPMLLLFRRGPGTTCCSRKNSTSCAPANDGFEVVATLTREEMPPARRREGQARCRNDRRQSGEAAGAAEAHLHLRVKPLRGERRAACDQRRRRLLRRSLLSATDIGRPTQAKLRRRTCWGLAPKADMSPQRSASFSMRAASDRVTPIALRCRFSFHLSGDLVDLKRIDQHLATALLRLTTMLGRNNGLPR